jgi:hypothetical protein
MVQGHALWKLLLSATSSLFVGIAIDLCSWPSTAAPFGGRLPDVVAQFQSARDWIPGAVSDLPLESSHEWL